MKTSSIFGLSTIGLLVFVGLILLSMWGCPTYNVWHQEMIGKAQLSKAQQNRQIAVQEARAQMESAYDLAAADTIRAHGVAKSNQIIGLSLENNQAYLYWLWIDNLNKSNSVIYVPTEGNMPIMEAGRFDHPIKAVKNNSIDVK